MIFVLTFCATGSVVLADRAFVLWPTLVGGHLWGMAVIDLISIVQVESCDRPQRPSRDYHYADGFP